MPELDAEVLPAAGPPLDVLGDLRVAGTERVDALLTRAAQRAGDRYAVRSQAGDLRYADLDDRATRLAAALPGVVGGSGAVVALALELHPAFPVAFFGIVRSGNVAALVNPLLREEALVHVLGLAGAQVAIVPPEVYRRLEPVRHRLPELRHIVLTHRDRAEPPPTLDELIEQAADRRPPEPAADPDAVACLQFTSGTTGMPKGVRLTHRNLTVNAAQTAHAHRVTESAVLFDYLPTFHLMHLTTPVAAAATLVLWRGDDPVASVRAAGRCRATHYYSLPMRLSKLAADERLTELAAPDLRAVLSGGSALPVDAGAALAAHFGVPVVQGYGLQETSPLTHFDDLDRPAAGSCGLPVAGTECRIVDLDTRAVAPVGAKGEVQVRGPQLMKGYLGDDGASHLDAEGWFSTGDVGYVDDGGRLYLVDRIKDVFKCDNWLVSPMEIERVLRGHPDVADCVVVDYPDKVRGAVPYALVVPVGDGAEAGSLAAHVAARLPSYQHLRHVELVGEIPRSATGKVRRRELREQIRDRGL